MNKFVFGAALAALSLGNPGVATAQRNNADILVVDTTRVFSECTACRAAQAQLQTQVNTLNQRRTTLSQQLRTEGQPLQTAVQALNGKQPDAALTARIQAFDAKQNQAAQEVERSAATIQSTEAHVNQQIGARLGPILETIRNTRRAAIILAKGSTLANDNAIDITNEALTQLNSQLPSVSVTPLPQQAAPAGQPQGR